MAGFNKMFIMVPLMLAARKIDGEDPDVVHWLRVAYFSVQSIIVLIVAYTFIQASTIASRPSSDRVVFFPQPSPPFGVDPNAKKKYTEATYSKHILTTARTLLASTLFGILLTAGLHFYKGMVIGLAIQSIMSPINVLENPLVKALIFGGGLKEGDFDEKTASQLTNNDEVLDENGNVVPMQRIKSTAEKSFEDVLLDTWDEGAKANLEPLMKMITKENCNYATRENKWTPLMVLSGLGAQGTGSAIRKVKGLGGDPAIVDVEGWNALHWAAFHGSLEAAKALQDDILTLIVVKDKEGKTPLDHAKAEGNEAVAKYLQDEAKSTNDVGKNKKE